MEWLTGNWLNLLPSPFGPMALAIMAVLCSFVLGFERFRKEKPVGFRTLGLVCFGACAYTMIGTTVASAAETPRIVGQVVSGIGFLGAGVILRGPFGITGLTSAATIWATAAVGCVIGSGHGGAGIGATFMIWVLLKVAGGLRKHLYRGQPSARATVRFRSNGGKSSLRLEEVFDEFHIAPGHQEWSCTVDHETEQVIFAYHFRNRHHRECLVRLADMPEIISIDREEERLSERLAALDD